VVMAIGMARSAKHRRDVVDLLAAARRRKHVIKRRQLAAAHLDAGGRQPFGFGRIAHQRAHGMSLRYEPPREIATGEAGGAGNEDGACHDRKTSSLDWHSRAGAGIVPRNSVAARGEARAALP